MASGLVAAAPPARADAVEALRYDSEERAHVVDLKVDRGFATMVVRRTVANLGPKSDQATFHLDIPDVAVATRLRTAGSDASGRTIWFEGELMEAEAAASKYQELTGIGGYYPKDPALLSWRHQGHLALQVFPVAAKSSKTVEYTLKLPLEYGDGAYRVELPPMGTETLSALVRISAAHGDDVVTVNGVAGASPIAARADRPLAIELRPRSVPRLDASIASFGFAEHKHLVRARIAAAPRLSEAPRGAHVVILFDGSRSMHDRESGLVAVRAYLSQMPGAIVDFLTFDRQVRAPIGARLPVAEALSRLSGLALEPRNGSRIDDALARADAILQASPLAARRVVVVTDTLTRSELTPVKIGAVPWKSGAVLHVAVVGSGEASASRDDDSPWATLPRRTGGLFWSASAPSTVDGKARAVFEEWARPKRIEKVFVKGVTGGFAAQDVLDEGQGFEHFAIADAPTTRVDLTGEMWSTPLSATFTPSVEHGKLAAALVFGTSLHYGLSDAEQMTLAMHGRAVSPVTSYLAIEPGVRPSNEGIDWGAAGTGGGGSMGQGFGVGHGHLSGVGGAARIDREGWLRDQLRAAADLCGVSRGTLSVSIETTLDEIVEIDDVTIEPRDGKAEACVREEMWSTALPAMFDAASAMFVVTASKR
ncbi:MAG: VWA domain-containing protein [Labilithrix sp.]|nr:VWA domain-containing protein [Labilithrix sp.]